MKYNLSRIHHYYQKLSNIKQECFYRIQSYATEIFETCQKLALCSDWSDELMKQKAEEIFFVNLENHVKIEMQTMNKCTSGDIRETIDRIEAMILEEITSTVNDKNLNKKYENSKSEQHKYKHAKNFKKRYCQYHKTSSHSNEECWHQNKQNTKEEDRKGKGYSICESIDAPKTIEMTLTTKNKKIQGLIDTGVTYNFIPEHVTDTLNLKVDNLEDQ